ncbi:hypothetical protein [Pedobacter nutrimenti]|uniref:hypothetical protein n=1 Tax=Pedobacter nutrimenti TaxID=1241337 RepID=UPI00292FCEA3|nr:hypothetical protein [Pedobacter nutrimenti]
MKTLFDSTDPQFWGYVFFISGILIRFIIGANRYRRRGAGGLQHFNHPYAVALLITFLEWVFKWAAYALILLGIFMLLNAKP